MLLIISILKLVTITEQSNVQLGLKEGQMEVLDKRVEARKKSLFYVKLFQEIEGVTVFSEPNEDFILIIGFYTNSR